MGCNSCGCGGSCGCGNNWWWIIILILVWLWLTGGNATSRNLQTILDSDCYTVARLACFCDNAYADAMGDRAALQKAVDILPGDTPEILQRRVMEQAEWVLLPRAAELTAKELVEKEG